LPKKAKDADASDPVQLHVKRRDDGVPIQLRFALKRQDVTTMLVQGTFPNYTQLIPATHEASVTVDTRALRRELQAASVLAAQSSGIVRFNFSPPGRFEIHARAEEEGTFEAMIPAKVEGEGKIALNWAHVDTFLKTVGTDAVELRITDPARPGLFLPVGEEGYQFVCMPMFVRWDD
ncbi:hypothetical protein LCGC14_1114720, partial [marine sediment metagenome]